MVTDVEVSVVSVSDSGCLEAFGIAESLDVSQHEFGCCDIRLRRHNLVVIRGTIPAKDCCCGLLPPLLNGVSKR